MKKLFFISFAIAIFFIFSFRNLGSFLDISEEPEKVDVIACLGGDKLGYRIKKTYQLYAAGYSKYIMINPQYDSCASSYLADNNVSPKNIIIMDKSSTNTMQEILFIKNFMLQHNMHNAIIVSDPPHLRRIKLIATYLAKFDDKGLRCIVIGSDPLWWKDKAHFYKHGFAIANALSELFKIPYNYLKYGVLNRLGLWEPIKEMFYPLRKDIKKIYKKIYHSLWTIYVHHPTEQHNNNETTLKLER